MKSTPGVDLKRIRVAVANYMRSEGCSCCRSSDHDKNREVLAKLLRVRKYQDWYDFTRYETNVRAHPRH
jgi:hypothetical protein